MQVQEPLTESNVTRVYKRNQFRIAVLGSHVSDNPIRIDLYSQARREKTDRERGLARASAVVSRVHARNPPFQSRALARQTGR